MKPESALMNRTKDEQASLLIFSSVIVGAGRGWCSVLQLPRGLRSHQPRPARMSDIRRKNVTVGFNGAAGQTLDKLQSWINVG